MIITHCILSSFATHDVAWYRQQGTRSCAPAFLNVCYVAVGKKHRWKICKCGPFLYKEYHALREKPCFKPWQVNSESNLVPHKDDVPAMPAVGVCGFAEDAEEGAEKRSWIGSLVANRGNSKDEKWSREDLRWKQERNEHRAQWYIFSAVLCQTVNTTGEASWHLGKQDQNQQFVVCWRGSSIFLFTQSL